MTLWVGWAHAFEYLVGVGVLGGLLALLLLIIRPVVVFGCSRLKHPPTIPKLLTLGEPVPYGVAIAGAFLYMLWVGMLPGLPLY